MSHVHKYCCHVHCSIFTPSSLSSCQILRLPFPFSLFFSFISIPCLLIVFFFLLRFFPPSFLPSFLHFLPFSLPSFLPSPPLLPIASRCNSACLSVLSPVHPPTSFVSFTIKFSLIYLLILYFKHIFKHSYRRYQRVLINRIEVNSTLYYTPKCNPY